MAKITADQRYQIRFRQRLTESVRPIQGSCTADYMCECHHDVGPLLDALEKTEQSLRERTRTLEVILAYVEARGLDGVLVTTLTATIRELCLAALGR